MPFIPFSALTCPLDGNPMRREGQTWRCESGHSFDIARQGHVHLLPVQHKRSRDPGDSKDMVAARQRFLNAGHYQPIADAVSRMTLADLPAGAMAGKAPLHCLDAGCGEGYYLRQLANASPRDTPVSLLGLDISKWAVVSAARQERAAVSANSQERESRASWVVGSNANLPVQDGSVDRLWCLFGFPVYAEFARVLKAGGRLLLAEAGPDHLRELREIIYPSVKDAGEREHDRHPAFRREAETSVRYALTLDGHEAIADLLAMTPHLYRASAEGLARAETLTHLTLTVDVRLTRFERLPISG